jgi:hypothetical protein
MQEDYQKITIEDGVLKKAVAKLWQKVDDEYIFHVWLSAVKLEFDE